MGDRADLDRQTVSKYNNLFSYPVSVIVTASNNTDDLRYTLDSLTDQTIDSTLMEVLIVSENASLIELFDVIQEYTEKYPFYKHCHLESEGLVSAFNYGIGLAEGKYLMFLEAGDSFSPDTVQEVVRFFEAHEDQIELVTFPSVSVADGKQLPFHYRYSIFSESGIYDLNDPPFCYLAQSTLSICSKNNGPDNILFDMDGGFLQKELKYATNILRRKLKLGFCKNGLYLKKKHVDYKEQTAFHAYYDFEPTVAFWENLFSEYDGNALPRYFQALFLDSLIRMTKSDALLPYHYNAEKLSEAKNRLVSLLNQIEDAVILEHPAITPYLAHFFISQKCLKDIHVIPSGTGYRLYNHETLIAQEEQLEIVIEHVRLQKKQLHLTGYIKSVLFNHCNQPKLFLITDSPSGNREELPLRLSSWSYYQTKLLTNCFWLFDCIVDLDPVHTFSFQIEADFGLKVATYASFNWQTPFVSLPNGFHQAFLDQYSVTYHDGIFYSRNITIKDQMFRRFRFWKRPKVWISRQLAMLPSKKYDGCWLYHDCVGHARDNGFYQFEHDIRMNDGIPRFYVINEEDFDAAVSSYPLDLRPFLVRFGSSRHKLLYLKSKKILTAFVELENYFPFSKGVFPLYKDVCVLHDLIYLQHGVLHAHTPWKYSRDRIHVDYEVVSTAFEEANLLQNYCFNQNSILACGMPRYDRIESCKEKKDNAHTKRILYAPSWRKYLVTFRSNKWIPEEEIFIHSVFFQETKRFFKFSGTFIPSGTVQLFSGTSASSSHVCI